MDNLETPEKTNNKKWLIVGINLLVFAVYSLIIFTTVSTDQKLGALFVILIIIAIQFLICIVLGFVLKNNAWFLAGFLVLLVSFATCVGLFTIH
jgi:hypothetical protein